MPNSNVQLPEWLESVDGRILAGIDARLFDHVRSAYDSPGRVYHSWAHILACLEQYRQMTFDNPRAVLMALIFHDAIYIAGRKDNEAKSAELAISELVELSNIGQAECEEISGMIMLTASHHAVGNPSNDAMKLLDIDLSILGAEWSIYETYASDVRKEFCPAVVSDFKFNIGRLKFLRSVQQKTNIFMTQEMRLLRERHAQENIAREISELEQQSGLIGRALAKLI